MSVRVPAVGTKPVRKQPIRHASYNDTSDGSADSFNPAMCSLVDKREVCAAVLREGLVQSFVDLFYLVHRVDTHVTADGHEKKEAVAISPAQMTFLRDHLTAAEKARRQGDVIHVFESYERLAVHFMVNQHDLRTGVFFYEKCLEIARISRNQDFELAALENLGNAYFGLKEFDKAKDNLESHLALITTLRGPPGAIASNNNHTAQPAMAQLSKVYEEVARQHETKAEYDLAIGIHAKFLRVRCLALATTFEALGHASQAMDYLNEYLITAEKIQNVVAQAEACRRLGLLYSAARNFTLAAEMMERNFDLIKNAAKSDTALLDQARISLGVIRAHQKFDTFVNFVTADVDGLLKWKAARTIEPNAS
ncbi:hypothetical protein B5M09_004668 [Aphanomyces astaci]|uniref:Tetratricopeptide repeat protein 29 n=1 Tax=Aphanomyces astaci TaxID=112090 RepID=A0A3R7ZAJ6_APHAT|nr:hypothetical protein B5M09_004668 [Aphanomyces astaci]